MRRYLQQVFFKGLIAILPVAVTLYLVIWLARGFERLFGSLLRLLLPDSLYVPGLGLIVGLLAIFAVGLMLELWLTRRLWQLGERLLDRMPLVRPVFGALKQVVNYVSGAEQPEGSRVVMVSFGDPPLRMLGLVTREDLGIFGEEAPEDSVAVFLPWSYQVGGFTVYVPRSAIRRVDLAPQEALRLAMTAGVATEPEQATRGATETAR